MFLRNISSYKRERERGTKKCSLFFIYKRKILFLRSKPQKNIVRVSLNIFPVVSSVEYTTSIEIRESNFSIQYQDAHSSVLWCWRFGVEELGLTESRRFYSRGIRFERITESLQG